MTAGLLTICPEIDGPIHTLALFGELDVATGASVQARLLGVETADTHEIVLDLRGLSFMDTAGVHLIARARERCLAHAKRLRLHPGASTIQRVRDLTAPGPLPFAA